MKSLKRLATVAATAAAATVATVAVIAPVQAQGLSFNIGAVSLYKYNGIDQDSRQAENRKAFRPAIQGGVDYDLGNGFYVGNWNSTGKFGSANVEINLYAGYTGQLTDALSFDVGVTRFIFPSEGSFNANQWHSSLTFGIATAKYTRTFGSGPDAARLSLSVAQPLTDRLTLEGGVGLRNRANFNRAYDYNLGLAYDFGNSLSASAMFSGAQNRKTDGLGKSRLILGVNQSF